MDRIPRRRDVLEAATGGGFVGLLRLVDAVDTEQFGDADAAAQADVGRVVDNTADERGIPDAEVHAFRLEAETGRDGAVEHIGSTRTDDEGRFGVGAEAGIASAKITPEEDRAVLLVAHWRGTTTGEPGRPPEWFGHRFYDPEVFLAAGEYTVTLDQRLLLHETVATDDGNPYGSVAVWDDFKGGYDPDAHLIRMEARSVRDPDTTTANDDIGSGGPDDELDDSLADEGLEEAAVQSGIFSLQFPEGVDYAYQYDSDSDIPSEPRPQSLFWTDDVGSFRKDTVAGHAGETSALLAVEDLPVPLYGALPPGGDGTPRFEEDYYSGTIDNLFEPGPIIRDPGPQNISYFMPYWSGGEQANSEQANQQGLDLLSFGLGLVSLIPGIGTLASLGLAGASIGVTLVDAASSPGTSVPDYAEGGNRDSIGSGYLDFDLGEYDFVTNGFQYETYAASQGFNLSGLDGPTSVCTRGLFKFRPVESSSRVVDMEHGFELDPSIQSPLEDDGVGIVTGSDEASETDPVGLRSPFVTGPKSARVDEEVSFEVTPIATFEGRTFEPDADQYDWTIARRGIDFDETNRQTGRLFEDEIVNKTGQEITHTFDIPETYTVSVTVTDGDRTASATRTIEVETAPLAEIEPVATDVDGQCTHPTERESVPATGEGAASFIAPSWCGTYKEYEAVPGDEHVIRTWVDGCEDCVLHNAAYEIQEPRDGEWETVRTVTEPRGKDFAGNVHELNYEPTADRFRIVNRHDQPENGRNLGIGFYVAVLAPTLDGDDTDDPESPRDTEA